MHGGHEDMLGKAAKLKEKDGENPFIDRLWNPVWQIFTGLCRNIKCNPNIFAASYNSLKWYENRRIQQALLWSGRCLI